MLLDKQTTDESQVPLRPRLKGLKTKEKREALKVKTLRELVHQSQYEITCMRLWGEIKIRNPEANNQRLGAGLLLGLQYRTS